MTALAFPFPARRSLPPVRLGRLDRLDRLRRLARAAAVAGVVATATGCSTAPLSFLNDNQVYYRTVLYRYPVYVVAVDGQYTAFRPVPIAPGDHLLTLDAAPVAGFFQPIQKIVPMTVAPCTRYYIAAQRTSPLTQDWNFVVEETFAVAGCDPAKENEKAKAQAGSGRTPATSSVESFGDGSVAFAHGVAADMPDQSAGSSTAVARAPASR